MHTLIVCDTEPIAIAGLRELLSSSGDFRVLAAEESLPEALQVTRELSPSVLLVDKALGIRSVLEALDNLRNSDLRTAAVVWGVSVSEAESVRLLQTGASGVIPKTAPLAVLLHCLRTVASGAAWMAPEAPALRHTLPHPRSVLTVREMQVRELVERGLKNKDIAIALGIRTGTVKIHLKHIFEKTGIHGRYGVALSGLKEKGLLATPACDVI